MTEFLNPLGEVEGIIFNDGVEIVNGKHGPFGINYTLEIKFSYMVLWFIYCLSIINILVL